MSIQALNWGLAQDQIENSATRFVLLILCNYANESGQCYPSRETIAKKTSLSVRTVQAHLNWLADNGFLQWSQRRYENKQSTNLYQIVGMNQGARDAPCPPFQGANGAEQGANDGQKQGARDALNTKAYKDLTKEEEPPLILIFLGEIIAGIMKELRLKTKRGLDEKGWLDTGTIAFENDFTSKQFIECFISLRKKHDYTILPRYVLDRLPDFVRNGKPKEKEMSEEMRLGIEGMRISREMSHRRPITEN